MIDYDFSEVENEVHEIIAMIKTCDCDCEEFNGFKTCGRCQAIDKISSLITSNKTK